MSIIIRLQNLPWTANALDIRRFFQGIPIPDGGVHIVGGEKGDAFIAFSSDDDARRAMYTDGGAIRDNAVKLMLSSKTEMQNVISVARGGGAPVPAPNQMNERFGGGNQSQGQAAPGLSPHGGQGGPGFQERGGPQMGQSQQGGFSGPGNMRENRQGSGGGGGGGGMPGFQQQAAGGQFGQREERMADSGRPGSFGDNRPHQGNMDQGRQGPGGFGQPSSGGFGGGSTPSGTGPNFPQGSQTHWDRPGPTSPGDFGRREPLGGLSGDSPGRPVQQSGLAGDNSGPSFGRDNMPGQQGFNRDGPGAQNFGGRETSLGGLQRDGPGGFGRDAPGFNRDPAGSNFNRDTAGSSFSRDTPGPGFNRDGSGPGFNREGSGPGFNRDGSGPSFSRDGSGPGFNRDASGPGFNRDASGPGFNRDASGPGGNRDASGPGFNRDTSGPGFNRDASGPGFNRDASGSGFKRDSLNSGFNRDEPSTGFNSNRDGPRSGFAREGTNMGFERDAPGNTGFNRDGPSFGRDASVRDGPATGFNRDVPRLGFGRDAPSGGFGRDVANTVFNKDSLVSGFGREGQGIRMSSDGARVGMGSDLPGKSLVREVPGLMADFGRDRPGFGNRDSPRAGFGQDLLQGDDFGRDGNRGGGFNRDTPIQPLDREIGMDVRGGFRQDQSRPFMGNIRDELPGDLDRPLSDNQRSFGGADFRGSMDFERNREGNLFGRQSPMRDLGRISPFQGSPGFGMAMGGGFRTENRDNREIMGSRKRGFPEDVHLYISNMPINISYKDVRRFFRGCEIPRDGLKLINDRYGKRIGVCYVRFSSEQDLNMALQRDGELMGDRNVQTERATAQDFETAQDSFIPGGNDVSSDGPPAKRQLRDKSPLRRTAAPRDSADSCAVLKNLSFKAETKDIRRFFSRLGIASRGGPYIEMGLDGRPTGNAFVEFESKKDFREALGYHGKDLMGRRTDIVPISKREFEERTEKLRKETKEREHTSKEVKEKDHKDGDKKSETEKKSEIKSEVHIKKENGTTEDDSAKDDGKKFYCIKMAGLPFSANANSVREFFKGMEIAKRGIHIVLNNQGKAAGAAFVEFVTSDDCKKALEKHKQFMGKRYIEIEQMAKKDMLEQLDKPTGGRAAPASSGTGSQSTTPSKIHRGDCLIGMQNLHFKVKMEDIVGFFRGFRVIADSIRLRYTRDGKPTGDAVVAFQTPDDAQRAIRELNKKAILGRPVFLHVN